MSEINGEVRRQFVNLDTVNGDTQVLTFSSYDDDTVVVIGEAGQDARIFDLSKEQLQELYEACGKALNARREVLDDRQVHFNSDEVSEYMERE